MKKQNQKVRDFKFYIQKLIFLGKKKERPLSDLIFIYFIASMVFLSIVSEVVNILLGLPREVILFNAVIIVVLIFFYFWVNQTKNIKTIRYLFLIVSILSTGFLWFFLDGSSGPSVLMFQAYITVLVFVSSGKEFNTMLGCMVLVTVFLFILEIIYPEYIVAYNSAKQRTLNELILVVLLCLVEIPLLIYARNVLFQERNQALETAESKSLILANISHEIRTPMNAIIGFTDLMADPSIEKQDSDNYLKIVNKNSRILMNLLNNVINMSKLESGNDQVYISKVNINKVVKFVYETLNSLVVHTNIELKVEYLEDEEAVCEVDENLLYQIIVNFGYNAIKFTQNGTVTFKVAKKGMFMIFSVKDTGCGIPKNQQKNLFERFNQVNNGVNMVPINGVGLGLSICKGLTDLLHGEIWFTSKENVGSEFFVKFPMVSKVNNK